MKYKYIYVYTNKNSHIFVCLEVKIFVCIYKNNYSYNCLYTQINFLCKPINTHINVCIHIYIYSYKCMFTQVKMTHKTFEKFINEIYPKPPKRIIPLTKQTFITLMILGVEIY